MHELGERRWVYRTQNQVPVVRQYAVGDEPDRVTGETFAKDSKKCPIIARTREEGRAATGAVEDVKVAGWQM